MEKCCTVSLSLDIMAKDFFFWYEEIKEFGANNGFGNNYGTWRRLKRAQRGSVV